MAEDSIQKSVQNIKDPNARKSAYYTRQREAAEYKAGKGDRDSAGVAAKINSKLGKGEKTDYYNSEKTMGKGGADFFKGLDKANSAAIPFASMEATGARSGGTLLGAAAKRFAPKAVQGVEDAASKVISGVSDKASKFMKSGSKSVRYGGAKAEGAAAKAASRSKGAVAKDFGKTAGKTASKSESKAYDLKGGGTTKEGPTGSRFNSNGSRKDAMVKPGQKDKVMSSMRDVKPSAAKKPTTMSAGTKRSSKEIAKDFGKQAKDNRPAAPSRPRMSTKEVGPTSRVSKSDVTHGRKKSSK